MKTIGFAQLRNELSRGNLLNWFRCMEFCDYIYIYDQASNDGSQEIYRQHKNVVWIQSKTNRFNEEIICKKQLLEAILSDHPDVDWIFWMDGDTCLDNRLMLNDFELLKHYLRQCKEEGWEGMLLHNLNLWRSNRYCRTDNGYNGLNPLCFWRNNGSLSFPDSVGLHLSQTPFGIPESKVFKNLEYNLIHYGFSTDEQIIERYENYKSLGQSGWELERLLDEDGLQLAEVAKGELPSFIDPSQGVCEITQQYDYSRKKIRDIYDQK